MTSSNGATQPPASRAKAEAGLIALAAADALGWPQEFPSKRLKRGESSSPSFEFRRWVRRGGSRFYPHEETICPGEYSDDTQLTLAVARSRMIEGLGWWAAFTRTELPLWTLYERGGGGATKRAADLWIKGTPPWKAEDERARRRYFEAGGNGVTMRVLPHAIFHASNQDSSALIRDVVTDGVATHGHPRALVGATAYAYAAWWLLRCDRTLRFGEILETLLDSASTWGALPPQSKKEWQESADRETEGGYEAVWRQVVQEMLDLLNQARRGVDAGAISDDEEVLKSLGCVGKSKGAGTICAAAAVYLCARFASQPVQAVIKAAFTKGADTDTLAAMTGGLMGCLTGRDWLPREWFDVQDCDYLRQLANKLALGPSGVVETPATLRKIGATDLDALLASLIDGHSGELDLDGVRRAQVVDACAPKALSRTTLAQVWQLRTSDGQTMYVTKLGRKPKGEGDARSSTRSPSRGTTAQEQERPSTLAVGVKLSVGHMAAAIHFYKELLGLHPLREATRFVSFGTVALVDARYAQDLSGGAVTSATGPGPSRVAIETYELDRIYKRLRDAGVEILQGLSATPWGQRGFHCRDPEGNIVEVLERRNVASPR